MNNWSNLNETRRYNDDNNLNEIKNLEKYKLDENLNDSYIDLDLKIETKINGVVQHNYRNNVNEVSTNIYDLENRLNAKKDYNITNNNLNEVYDLKKLDYVSLEVFNMIREKLIVNIKNKL